MPIKLRCYCGYVLTLRSELAGKKIHCTECEEILTVPFPGQNKSLRKATGQTISRHPQPQVAYRPQPSDEQPQTFLPEPQYVPPHRSRSSERSQDHSQKIIVIAIVAVFLSVAILAGIFTMFKPNTHDASTTGGGRAVERNRGNGFTNVSQDHTVKLNVLGDFSHLNIHLPDRFYIFDQEEIAVAVDLMKPGRNDLKEFQESPQPDKEILLFMAIKDFETDPTARNAVIAIAASRIGNLPGSDTPRNFLMAINRERASLPGNGFRTATIQEGNDLGHLKTAIMESSEMDKGVRVTTKVFVARVHDFFLGVTLTYTSESEREELESIVRSIQGLR